MGRIILAGGAAVGLGALCYYGLGMSNEIGAIEKAVWVSPFWFLAYFCFEKLVKRSIFTWLSALRRIWPQYVKDRIHSTYMYFAGSIGLTALSAVAVSRTPALMGLMMRGSWLVSFVNRVDHTWVLTFYWHLFSNKIAGYFTMQLVQQYLYFSILITFWCPCRLLKWMAAVCSDPGYWSNVCGDDWCRNAG